MSNRNENEYRLFRHLRMKRFYVSLEIKNRQETRFRFKKKY